MGTNQSKEINNVHSKPIQNDEQKMNNELIENHDVESYIMKKPYIIIIGICPYDSKPKTTLRAVPQDIANMKHLWLNQFKYDENYVKIVTEDINSQYISISSLNEQLSEVQAILNLKQRKECDGLIIIYSGHGSTNGFDNYILCSDCKELSILAIENKFSSQGCPFLAGKPKILYLDCCRGIQNINATDIQYKEAKGTQTSHRFINVLSDFYIHFATCQDYESWGKSEQEGSHFIYALYNCYINNYNAYKINGISLHESSIKINEMVNKSYNGNQTSEILDRLTYNVFIQPHTYTSLALTDKVLSRYELIDKYKSANHWKIKYDNFYNEAMRKKQEYEIQSYKYWMQIQQLSMENICLQLRVNKLAVVSESDQNVERNRVGIIIIGYCRNVASLNVEMYDDVIAIIMIYYMGVYVEGNIVCGPSEVESISQKLKVLSLDNFNSHSKSIESFECDDNVVIEHPMRNPLVIIIGVAAYDRSTDRSTRLPSLPAVKEDISKMKHLWQNIFQFDMKILTEFEQGKYATCSKAEILRFIGDCQKLIRYQNEEADTPKYDGLICIISGHGCDNKFIATDGQPIDIQKYFFTAFNAHHIESLANYPKIFLIDVNRGYNFPNIIIKENHYSRGCTELISCNIQDGFRISYSTTPGMMVPDAPSFIQSLYDTIIKLYDKEILNDIDYQTILRMSSQNARQMTGNCLCPVHEDYTNYKIFIKYK
eukprot:278493_1